MLNVYILTAILGVVSGLLGGAIGQSGSEIMLPGLLVLGIVSNFKTAAGTVLLTVLAPLSLLAISEYYRRGEINFTAGIILIVTNFFAAYVGAYSTESMSDSLLQYIAAFYFLSIGVFFLWNAHTGYYGEDGSNVTVHKPRVLAGFKQILKFFSQFIKQF